MLNNCFYAIVVLVIVMKEKNLEKKIRKSTLEKDYETSKFILLDCYIKHFKKMLRYKNIKIDNKWYMYDYLMKIKEVYSNFYSRDIDEMLDVLYSDSYDLKSQIVWLIENATIFNDYKL